MPNNDVSSRLFRLVITLYYVLSKTSHCAKENYYMDLFNKIKSQIKYNNNLSSMVKQLTTLKNYNREINFNIFFKLYNRK